MNIEKIVPFVICSLISFLVGAAVLMLCMETQNNVLVEEGMEMGWTRAEKEYAEKGYTKAYTEQFGYDIGVPVAKCKLSGGEPVVNGKRVACLKEMKDD